MAYDEGIAEQLREALAEVAEVEERRMFGGLCFLVRGNMICGASGWSDTMFRVGKAAEAAALEVPGTRVMEMGGRRMGGFIRADESAMGDDAARARLMGMALAYVQSLPAK
ncbi:TfoX/Sxy family protein [Vannielia litorea]|uniref:TfoX N-terminal domain-containing protein n=1 Tax=Vannielia litorea TaxID=1217970 RepID=A0A1N6F544_9RHOB|nr:TfoX/Sxy family protein [Vannielia litorea]SIN90380.1 TfoX N-terminal domain-containing protein [Vannielia litorea]